MVRFYIFLLVCALILTVFTLVLAALTSREHTRTLPKYLWLPIIALVPVLGPVLWLVFGRQRAGSGRQRGAGQRGVVSAADPEVAERETAAKERARAASDDKIAELEQYLRDLDAEAAAAAGSDPAAAAGANPAAAAAAGPEAGQNPDDEASGGAR